MNKEQTLTVNEIETTGRIISESKQKNGTTVITVYSDNGKGIYPKFVCRGNVLPEHGERARVKIKAHIEMHPVRIQGEWVKRQQFYADEITLEDTMTQTKFGIKGKFFSKPHTILYLMGKVQYVKKDGEWYRYIIEVDTDRKDRNSSDIHVSMRKTDRHPDVKEGMRICCVCNLSTPKKEINEKVQYFEDIIISDIAIVPSATEKDTPRTTSMKEKMFV